MLPGVELPPGSLAAAFTGGFTITGLVSIAYEAGACGANPIRLPITAVIPTKVVDVKPAWPVSVRNPPCGRVVVKIATIEVDGFRRTSRC